MISFVVSHIDWLDSSNASEDLTLGRFPESGALRFVILVSSSAILFVRDETSDLITSISFLFSSICCLKDENDS